MKVYKKDDFTDIVIEDGKVIAEIEYTGYRHIYTNESEYKKVIRDRLSDDD